MLIVKTAIELGLLYCLIPLGLFLSFRILNIADLTTDGSFVLGMCVSVVCTAMGHPLLGLLLAILCGMIAGGITGILQTYLGIQSIIAGIITSTGLYTINLMVMGFKAQVSLLQKTTVFSALGQNSLLVIAVLALIVFGLLLILYGFLKTRLGLSLRATGDNPQMVSASSINVSHMTILGLMLANGCIGLCGGLVGQYSKIADINSGTGIVVVGLACLMIGEALIHGQKNLGRHLLAVVIGSIVYRLIYAMILQSSLINVQSLKLMTAVVVAFALSIDRLKVLVKKHVRN